MWRLLLLLSVISAGTAVPLLPSEENCGDESTGVYIYVKNDERRYKTLAEEVRSLTSAIFQKEKFKHLFIAAEIPLQCPPIAVDIAPNTFQGLSGVEEVYLLSVILSGPLDPHQQLTSLKTLVLNGNNFTEFPTQSYLHMSQLEQFIIRRQPFTTLSPASFANVPDGLNILRIQFNDLAVIAPASFKQFRHLRILNLNRNKLRLISARTFEGLSELQELDLSENKLTEIEKGAFSHLENVKGLWLRHNHLEHLPYGIFENLWRLETLSLRGNPLKAIPYIFLMGNGNLLHLSLGFGRGVAIEGDVFSGINLKTLTLDSDDLSHIEADTFYGLSSKELVIYRNRTINFQPNLFRGMTAQEVAIHEEKMDVIDQRSWGLSGDVPIYSIVKPNINDPFTTETTRYSS